MRRSICAGNWKMFKTAGEAASYADVFLPLAQAIDARIEIVLCPPFTALAAVADRLRGQSRVSLGSQNVCWEDSGAFTGEISPLMLRDLGVRFAIVGHSERRRYFGESDEMVRRKTAAALRNGLTPIVAVGESLETRDSGGTLSHVVAQTQAALNGLDADSVRSVVMAYEPIWSIGTGQNCDPDEADRAIGAIRGCVDALREAPILYGGSVTPENIAEYSAQPEIDGALVGGASLDPQGFARLCARI